MALTNDQITAQNFKDFYTQILPYLNGGNYVEKSVTAGLLKNDGTVDTTTYASEQGVESLIDSTVGWTGKNLLRIPSDIVSNAVGVNGITYTVNRNSDGEVTSIVLNGTASANTDIQLVKSSHNFAPPTGNYIFSSGVESNNIQMRVEGYNGSTWVKFVATSVSPAAVNLDYNGYEKISVSFRVNSGTQLDNVPFYFMFRDAKVTDATYEPYHKSVEECLEEINDKLSYLEQSVTLSTSASTTVTFTDSSITANSFIEYACSVWDLVPESITGAAGSCTIVLPKVDSAQSVTVRIYVR